MRKGANNATGGSQLGASVLVAGAMGGYVGHDGAVHHGRRSVDTPGVTSNSITIGATVPLTGPAAPGYDEIAPAMDASSPGSTPTAG